VRRQHWLFGKRGLTKRIERSGSHEIWCLLDFQENMGTFSLLHYMCMRDFLPTAVGILRTLAVYVINSFATFSHHNFMVSEIICSHYPQYLTDFIDLESVNF